MPLRIGRLKPKRCWGAAEDLFLGYWNSGGSDVVLRNNEGGVLGGGRAEGGSGVWRVGDVTVSQAVANNAINAAQEQKLSTFGTPNHQPPAINHQPAAARQQLSTVPYSFSRSAQSTLTAVGCRFACRDLPRGRAREHNGPRRG